MMEATKPRVVVAIPHIRPFEGYFLDSIVSLSSPPGSSIIRVEGKPVDLARNMLVEGFLNGPPEYTHLFFVDSDMIIPSNALLRLVQRNEPLITGTYFARSTPPIPHLYNFHHQDDEATGECPLGREHPSGFGRWYRPLAQEMADFLKAHPEYKTLPETTILPVTDDSLVDIDAAGGGCLLIAREVLERMEYPYFQCHERSAGGEDFYFLEKAKALGYQLKGDLTVQCQHEYRGIFMDRLDYEDWAKLGLEDEKEFGDLIVDMSPFPIVNQRPDNVTALRADSEAS